MISSNYGIYRNLLFTQVWNKYQDFLADYQASKLKSVADTQLQTIFYLLYAKYGNSQIKSNDVNQFKYKLWSIIYSYGPTWAKQLDIQKKLRELNEDELTRSAKQILNRATNPGTKPGTSSLEELTYINEQNTRSLKRSKVEAYAVLAGLLNASLTQEFIDRFAVLFNNIVQPEEVAIYEFNMEDYTL